MPDNLAVQAVLQQFEALKSDRMGWESMWQELVDFVLPRRGDISTKTFPGRKRGIKIFDSTGTDAAEILAAALHGMLTNPLVPWLALYTTDYALRQAPDVKLWLSDTTDRLLYYMAMSNFGSKITELYTDLVAFGTGFLYVEFDPEIIFNFVTPYLAEMFISQDRRGITDTVFRAFDMTAKQIVQTWPKGYSDKVTKAIQDNKPETSFEILHAVFPRLDGVRGVVGTGKPFASFYIETAGKSLLEEDGYDIFPYMTPRWSVLSGETYGRGPGVTALPDIKMLQEIVKTGLKAQHKAVDPPVQYPDNMVLTRLRLTPGGSNQYRSGSTDRIETIGAYGAQVPLGLQVEDRWREKIRQKFLNDQLQLITQDRMTAEEVVIRKQDQLRILGPVAGRLFSELLNPLVRRCLTILNDNGLLLPMPAGLKGKVAINYVSPIAKAQKGTELQAINRFLAFLQPFAQIDPTVMKAVNVDQTIQLAADDLGVPPVVLAPVGTAAEARQNLEQSQTLQQGADVAQNLGRTVKNVGSVDPEQLKQIAQMAGVKLPGGAAPAAPTPPPAAEANTEINW